MGPFSFESTFWRFFWGMVLLTSKMLSMNLDYTCMWMPHGPALSISIAGDTKRLTLGKPFNDALIYTLDTTSIQNLRPFCLGINSKKISQTQHSWLRFKPLPHLTKWASVSFKTLLPVEHTSNNALLTTLRKYFRYHVKLVNHKRGK